MDTLRGMLGEDADEKIKNAMNMLASSGIIKDGQNEGENNTEEKAVSTKVSGGQNSGIPLTAEGIELLGQMRKMVDRISNTNDSRSDLLKSLKPFMRSDRRRSIDKLIRVMNIGRFSGLLGGKRT